jgi:ParB family transcriptional regulator, chromosome partitioning protein
MVLPMTEGSGGRRLGRGLKALISVPEDAPVGGELIRVPLSKVRPNPFQPRKTFNPEELAELEASLAASGLLQPITVRRSGDAFELIAGERRLRAATNLGWTEIPALVKDIDDRSSLVLALVENLQRSDLNPVDEARGYQRLADEFEFTHQQIADSTGKDRATISNLLRLLTLPEAVIQMVANGQLSTGHAKALVPLPGSAAISLAREIVAHGLSVRTVEERARGAGASDRKKREPGASRRAEKRDSAAAGIEDAFRKRLQTDVHLVADQAGKGHLKIQFYSHDDLERVMDIIMPGFRDT